ncbi:MAG: PqqD family protein [Pseudomonadota bacterium]
MATEVDDALVLLDLEGGMYFALNGPAADVWEALEAPKSEAALIDGLVDKYNVERAHCTRSVETLLRTLAEKGLAKRAD